MSSGYLLGIDLGTTVLKVCVFDQNGTTVSHTTRRLPVHSSADRRSEQSPQDLERHLRNAVRALHHQLGSDWQKIAGVGLSAQGGSTIIANRGTGNALTPMILWNDARPNPAFAEIIKNKHSSYWQKMVLRNLPPAGLSRLHWLKQSQPDLFSPDNIHAGAGDYLFFHLTNHWRQDAGSAIQIGCYNAAKKTLDPQLLKWIDVPLSMMAPLRQGLSTVPLSKQGAKWLHLREGVPVAGPFIDQEAAYLSTLDKDNPLMCSFGTAWVGNFMLPANVSGSSPTQLVIPGLDENSSLIIQPLLTGNKTWEWGMKTFCHTRLSTAFTKSQEIMKEQLLPPDGLIAIPWNTQSNPFFPGQYGGGMFFGLNNQTKHEDMLRALAVSMMFEFKRMFSELVQSNVIDKVVLGGGASKADYFRTLAASLFHPLPVYLQEDEDLSAARGSIYPFSAQAAHAKCKKVMPVNRKETVKLYQSYELYLSLFERIYEPVLGNQAYAVSSIKGKP